MGNGKQALHRRWNPDGQLKDVQPHQEQTHNKGPFVTTKLAKYTHIFLNPIISNTWGYAQFLYILLVRE